MSGQSFEMISQMRSLLSSDDPAARLKGVASLFVFSVGLLFVNLFLYPLQFNVESALFCGVFYASISIIREFVFSFEDLLDANNKSPESEFYRSSLPTLYILKKYNISIDRAKYVWFELMFNKMKDKKHPRHEQWKRTLNFGYTCRFVCLIWKISKVVPVLGVAFIVVENLFRYIGIDMPASGQPLGAQILFLVSVFVVGVGVRRKNKVERNGDKFVASGIWLRFEEINALHFQWINQEYEKIVASGGDGGKVGSE